MALGSNPNPVNVQQLLAELLHLSFSVVKLE